MQARTVLLVSVAGVAVIVALAVANNLANRPTPSPNTLTELPPTEPPPVEPPPTEPPPPGPSACPKSVGLCVERTVTRVIDGDTFEAEGNLRIRLVLVDAPELGETGGPEAREYLTSLCLGQRALVDEDDNQVGADPFGRVLAVVYCGGTNANAAMISSGHATPFYAFCSVSEFGAEAWTGCASPPLRENCDPAYPTVCIPPPPPDLHCGDISYRDFQVLPSDPHRFDGDHDGIGCET